MRGRWLALVLVLVIGAALVDCIVEQRGAVVIFPLLFVFLLTGFPARYAIGSMATAGSLGIMIPPSVPLVLYGFVTNESVGKLFMAGILPGLFQALVMGVICYYVARRGSYPLQPRATWTERWA